MDLCSWRQRYCLIGLAATTVLFSAGCDTSSPPAAVAAAAEPASAAAATPSVSPPVSPPAGTPDAKSFTTTGPLVAEQQADVGTERDGRIVAIAVQMGDHVQAGQLLAQLDDRMPRASSDAQKAHIAAVQAEVREWQAEEESARANLRRADALHDARILSDEEWEVARYKLVEVTAEVARYQSEQAESEANLAAATAQLAQSRLVAPFAGVVGRSSVRLDQEVKAGDSLFWITAESQLHVLFTVPETLMASFTAGVPLDLTTADFPGLHQPGHILRVSPVVDPASGSVQVIAAVDHRSPLLKPGMQMQVRLAP
jgi:RND family efflux transporter MFP subunit